VKDIPIFNINFFFVGRVMTQGLVAGLSPGKPDFRIWLVCVGFVVGKVTLVQVFLGRLLFPPVIYYSTNALSFIYLRRYIIAAFDNVFERRKKSLNAGISTLPGIL
jgi:hypothetical protein